MVFVGGTKKLLGLLLAEQGVLSLEHGEEIRKADSPRSSPVYLLEGLLKRLPLVEVYDLVMHDLDIFHSPGVKAVTSRILHKELNAAVDLFQHVTLKFLVDDFLDPVLKLGKSPTDSVAVEDPLQC